MIYRFAHPEFFKNWKKPDLEKENGNIILYGAGRRGSVAAHCLKQRRINFICFCDSDEKKWGTELCGHTVISPAELDEKYRDSTILIDNFFYNQLSEELKAKGFKKLFSCVFLYLEIDFNGFDLYSQEFMSRYMDQYFYSILDKNIGASYMTQVLIPITMRCTLRCKECSTYVPYLKAGKDFNVDEIKKYVSQILTAYETIGTVMLYGGEPLLHNELYKLIEEFSQNPQIEKTVITTNGTLLPDERTIKAMKNSKVWVRISDYDRYSSKKNKLINLLKQNDVKTEITDFGYWNKTPVAANLNETEKQLFSKTKYCCGNSNMIALVNGRLYYCTVSAMLHYMNAVPDTGDDYVDLCSPGMEGKPLFKKLEAIRSIGRCGTPTNVCRYCTYDMYSHVAVAEQTKELLEFKKVY
ncbi:MAG: radical SAM protein [Acidaminococcaceae bacterium]|nr:radical SAM protein [Acidaminococcaceae bacterium]